MTPDEHLHHQMQVLACIAKVCAMTPERVARAIDGMQRDGMQWADIVGVFQEIARAQGNLLVARDDLLKTTGRAAFFIAPGGGHPS